VLEEEEFQLPVPELPALLMLPEPVAGDEALELLPFTPPLFVELPQLVELPVSRLLEPDDAPEL
jgi:hypothetical protein